MTPRSATRAIGTATAALLAGDETADVLSRLIRDCATLLSAGAIGVLVVSSADELDILSATSHRVAELELYQIQRGVGPCVDAIREATPTSCVGEPAITTRWADVGRAIVDAGYLSVHAYPMRWHGTVLGALNVFCAEARSFEADEEEIGQAIADVATLTLTRPADLSADQLIERIRGELEVRSVVEQAKGVLAYRHRLDAAGAFERLVALSEQDGRGLSETAREIVAAAQRDVR